MQKWSYFEYFCRCFCPYMWRSNKEYKKNKQTLILLATINKIPAINIVAVSSDFNHDSVLRTSKIFNSTQFYDKCKSKHNVVEIINLLQMIFLWFDRKRFFCSRPLFLTYNSTKHFYANVTFSSHTKIN